jgi:hypothetical protein
MFDIDAIRREVAILAAESKPYHADEREFEIKQIKSTLPPMKIELPPQPPPTSPHANLRETKSYNDSLGISAADSESVAPNTNGTKKSFEEYDEGDAGEMEMTFDTSFREPTPSPLASKTSLPTHDVPNRTASSWESHTPTKPSAVPSRTASPWQSTAPAKPSRPETGPTWDDPAAPERPNLFTAKTAPHGSALNGSSNTDPAHNAWADEFEDDFGQEREVKMSFM